MPIIGRCYGGTGYAGEMTLKECRDLWWHLALIRSRGRVS